MNVFKRLFLSSETKNLLSALDIRAKEFSASSGIEDSLELHSAWEIVKQKSQQIIFEDEKKFSTSIREKKTPIQRVALNLVYKVSKDCLSMGDYHVYRGVLSGIGLSLLDIFKASLQEFVSIESITKAQMEEVINEIQEDIKSVG